MEIYVTDDAVSHCLYQLVGFTMESCLCMLYRPFTSFSSLMQWINIIIHLIY